MDKRTYYQTPSIARTYESVRFRRGGGLRTHAAELREIQAVFKPEDHLLELACGTGRLLRPLRTEGWHVEGVDASREMLLAGSLREGVDARVADVFELPFATETFDGAYCFRFTNHYPDLVPLLREWSRVLRMGGGLLFDTMRWSLLRRDSPQWGGKNYPQADERVLTALQEAGLERVWCKPLFPIGPYLLSRMPGWGASAILTAGRWIPDARHAVALWYAKKIR